MYAWTAAAEEAARAVETRKVNEVPWEASQPDSDRLAADKCRSPHHPAVVACV